MLDPAFPPGIWIHSKATDDGVLSDDVLDVLLDRAARVAFPRSGIIAWQVGGAIARVGELETPFGGRSSGFLVDILGLSPEPERPPRERYLPDVKATEIRKGAGQIQRLAIARKLLDLRLW